jgi:four helix bundle protein
MTYTDEDFESWAARQHPSCTSDPLWHMKAYRLGLYGAAIGWTDVEILSRHRATRDIASQLFRALGSIPANLAEGFSRYSSRDRARYYEYTLGSTRESSAWYNSAERVLGREIVERRYVHLEHVRRLMLTTIKAERNG